ncbi:hypothetical protein HGM15179_012170 [Zosterops borbonicus]|uniref:Uncharacterized protein n=1 Tax=Zosterops borbonicus TaxID=364589 RepID=A0A8K1GAR8_9PASS|nr:hypothetical protein HGM15179_012170 [Zosterops borbonicus]
MCVPMLGLIEPEGFLLVEHSSCPDLFASFSATSRAFVPSSDWYQSGMAGSLRFNAENSLGVKCDSIPIEKMKWQQCDKDVDCQKIGGYVSYQGSPQSPEIVTVLLVISFLRMTPASGDCGVFLVGDFQNQAGHGPGQVG